MVNVLEYVANESINSRSYRINIQREEKQLGTIELVVSIDAIFSHMLGQLYIILIKNGFKTAFVVFFMFILFRSLGRSTPFEDDQLYEAAERGGLINLFCI